MITLTLIFLGIVIFVSVMAAIITGFGSIIAVIGGILLVYAAIKVIIWLVSWIITKVHEYKENENNNQN